MWKEIRSSPPLFLSFQKKCGYHILVTDYVKIWEAFYTEDEFLSCLKESNFGLEINTEELIEKGNQMLLNPNDIKSLNVSNNELFNFISMTKLFSYPLHLKMKLNTGSCELFFQEVTQKLLQTVKDLRCSEHELRQVLKKKEEEICKYKEQGAKIRYTAIPPYRDEKHMQKHSVYNINFGETDIPNSLLDKTAIIARNNAGHIDFDCKKNIKQEPVSQEITSNETTTHTLNESKQESIKNEVKPMMSTRSKRKRLLNI